MRLIYMPKFLMAMLKIKSNKAFLNFFCIIKYFFLSGFSFTDTDESQDANGNGEDHVNSLMTEVPIIIETSPLI